MNPALFLFPFAMSAALVLAACGQQSPRTESPQSQEQATSETDSPQQLRAGFDLQFAGRLAPDIALETSADGATQTIADIRRANPGKPVFVNLWASWCAPCLTELPTIDALAAKAGDQLIILPISQDMEGWAKVDTVFGDGQYPHLETRLESRMEFGRAVGATGLPVSIYYDAEGIEVWRYVGDFDWMSTEAQDRLGL